MYDAVFEVGGSYSVWHLDDMAETVEIAGRDGKKITLSDGRRVTVDMGLAPDGSESESFRLPRNSRSDGVARACHRVRK